MVKELINKSEENNQDAGITGVLLATATHFLQVLEGSYDEVNALFMRIVRDLRHDQVQLIAFDCIESRLYGGWAMHGVGVFDFNQEFGSGSKVCHGSSGFENRALRLPVSHGQWFRDG